jgi:flagellin-specific chaperone FliS
MINKDKKLSIRVSGTDLETIHHKADQAKMSLTEYVTKCCLGKQIIIINDLDSVLREQKSIGKNLNQLTTLAHMGRVNAVNLSETLDKCSEIQESLQELLERRRWRG